MFISERLLHFIWQHQYFNRNELTTVSGEPLEIIRQGTYNTNQGPDFADGKLKIGKTIWAGTIELHVRSSDWEKHKHDKDNNYNNVILHVVWENDIPEKKMPALELKGRISRLLLQRYEELMNSTSFIPCEKSISTIKEITWKAWKDRLLAERLLRKSAVVENCLAQNKNHWEETCWWLLAKNFGVKINSDAFEAIAQSLPLSLLAKHKNQLTQLEALLLGQAGLLEKEFKDHYPILLQREYLFLKKKYKLKPIHQPIHFLRMRPGNFPTIRLVQLAALINRSTHLFAKFKDTDSISDIRHLLDVTANDYWHYHYRPDELSAFKEKHLGNDRISSIIINTVCPLLFAWGHYHGEQKYKDKAIEWLEQTAAERNTITKGFRALGVENKNAFDSQAIIELKNSYCDKKRCLECSIGYSIINVT